MTKAAQPTVMLRHLAAGIAADHDMAKKQSENSLKAAKELEGSGLTQVIRSFGNPDAALGRPWTRRRIVVTGEFRVSLCRLSRLLGRRQQHASTTRSSMEVSRSDGRLSSLTTNP